jgi:hypothetical protein
MKEVVTIGLDLAKNVFQVHGIGADGGVLVRRQLRRAEVLRFLSGFRLASSGWKPVPRRITGRARSARSATP